VTCEQIKVLLLVLSPLTLSVLGNGPHESYFPVEGNIKLREVRQFTQGHTV
jgi:hypothetical protein